MTAEPPDLDQAARLLLDLEQAGTVIDALPASMRPITARHGYGIQARLATHRGEPVVGWKIAATAAAGRRHINVDHPLAGRLFAPVVFDTDAQIRLGANRMRVAEAEIVLKLGRDLAPRPVAFTEADVADAVESIHPGLELPDSRFADFTRVGAASLIADNACASQFVLGPGTPIGAPLADLAGLATTLLVNDEPISRGEGSDALGGPLKALTWLANTLRELDIALLRGQFVTTGVTGQPSTVAPGNRVCVDLGRYGRVQAKLV